MLSNNIDIDKLLRKYIRQYFKAKHRYEELYNEYKGNEMNLTFHAGRHMAMYEFRMYELDNILDDFGIDTNELKLKEWFK
jgi:hypothetical protein